jgi:hypothetical protein
MANFQLDDNAMKDLIAKSIIDALTPERRDALIADAIKQLLASKTGDRYDARSQLQIAFDYAVSEVARKVAMEQLGGDAALATKMRELMLAGWERMNAGENHEKLVSKIASSMERAISGRDY